IEQTAERYLDSLKAFWKTREEESRSREAVKEFKESPLVRKLQERLEERARDPESKGNW
ncbi:hypothetical protein BT69DRAFT_1330140, partial [Atractiella rhizophila]